MIMTANNVMLFAEGIQTGSMYQCTKPDFQFDQSKISIQTNLDLPNQTSLKLINPVL